MYEDVEDVRAYMQEVLTRRKTDEQTRHQHLHARRWTWLAVALWTAVLILSCLTIYKLLH